MIADNQQFVSLNDYNKLSHALRQLLDYTGGSDAPDDHPITIARKVLDE